LLLTNIFSTRTFLLWNVQKLSNTLGGGEVKDFVTLYSFSEQETFQMMLRGMGGGKFHF